MHAPEVMQYCICAGTGFNPPKTGKNDCAPANAGSFALPAEVAGVRFTNKVTLAWNSAAPGAGSATVHDVLLGAVEQLPVGNKPAETCLASGLAGTSTAASASPAAGKGFWYLVRGHNACGAGSWGTTSGGAPRTSTRCP